MRGGGEVLHPLAFEGDADQQRTSAPRAAAVKEGERPIVVPASHPEAHAPPIDADERHEHRVEMPRIDARPHACRLADAVCANRKGPSRAGKDEPVALRVLDARQIEAATGKREASQRRREIGLARQGMVGRDVAQGRRQPRGEPPCNREGMSTTRRRIERRASSAQVTPEGCAVHRRRGGRGATRLCRCQPLLSTRATSGASYGR